MFNFSFTSIRLLNRYILFLALFAVAILPLFSYADNSQKVELLLSVDKTNIALGESLTLALSMKAGSDSPSVSISSIDIPGIESFSQSSIFDQTQVQIINGVSAVLHKSERTLYPNKTGEFTIGPAILTLPDGTNVKSNTVTVVVSDKKMGFLGIKKTNNDLNIQKTKDVGANSKEKTSFKKFDSSFITDAFLWVIIIGLLIYIVYIVRKTDQQDVDSKGMSVKHSKSNLNEKNKNNTNMKREENGKIGDYDEFVSSIVSLGEIKDKKQYGFIFKEIIDFISKKIDFNFSEGVSVKDVIEKLNKVDLDDSKKNILHLILTECDIGKYAPYDQKRTELINSLIDKL